MEVSGDEGVSGVSNERLRKGSGLLRTLNGDNGFLKMICDDDKRSLCFCSFFFCAVCVGVACVGGKLKTFSFELSGRLLR